MTLSTRLAVALDGRRFAQTLTIAGSHAYQCSACDRFFAARDFEHVNERQIHRRNGDRYRGHSNSLSRNARILLVCFIPKPFAGPQQQKAPLDRWWYGRGARLRLARSARWYRTDLRKPREHKLRGRRIARLDAWRTGARAAPTCENAGSFTAWARRYLWLSSSLPRDRALRATRGARRRRAGRRRPLRVRRV